MSRTSPAKIAREAFASNAIDLLRRALAEGLGAHILVDPHGVMTHADLFDGDGAELLTLKLNGAQLALPLAPAPSQPPPAVPTAPVVEAPPTRGETVADIVAMGAHANAQMAARQALAVGDRILLDGVAVEVLGVDRDGFIWRTTDGGDFEEGDVEWSAVQHVAGDVWAPRGIDEPPVATPVEEPPPVEAPKPAAKKPRAKKAPAKAAAPAVEAPAAGVWQLIERLRDGTVEHNEWEREDSARAFFAASKRRPEVAYAQLADASGAMVDEYTAGAVEIVTDPHPRAVLGRWTLVEGYTDGTDDEVYSWPSETNARDMMAESRAADICAHATLIDPRGVVVDTYTAPAVEAPAAASGLWRLVEHPIGASPHEETHDEAVARRLYAAIVAHDGKRLRRIELFDEIGLLVDSHNYGAPASPTPRGLDGVPATVPAHLRDLAALTVADWWCVVAQQAVRPDLTAVKLCTDESTATATAERARLEDDSANTATRIVVFTATGEVHDAWHRWSPVVSAAVEAHPDVELFRVATPMTDAFSDVTLWAPARGMAWFASGHQRNSPAEVREGDAWVLWGRQNSDAVAIIPRALVVLVERRAAGWKLDLAIEPWTASTECSALRVGSRVEVRGEEWKVFHLPDHETATLTRDPDEIATVALAEVHPSGTAAGWWAERLQPKKAEKKAPKRAKAVA